MFSKSLLKHWKWKGIWKLSDEKPRKRLQWKRLHSVAYHLRYKKIQEWPCKEIFRIAKNCKIDTKNREKTGIYIDLRQRKTNFYHFLLKLFAHTTKSLYLCIVKRKKGDFQWNFRRTLKGNHSGKDFLSDTYNSDCLG